MNPLKIFTRTLFSNKTVYTNTIESIYNININALNGKPITLSSFKGKYILFVNVASNCGFTPQYKELQDLYNTYNKQLIIIGVPCNQFGNQEPNNAKAIQSFCEVNYGVTFLITEKINVKGTHAHPLYKWLTKKSKNGISNSSVKWNFQKYLVDTEGHLIDYYYSTTKPTNIKITKHFK